MAKFNGFLLSCVLLVAPSGVWADGTADFNMAAQLLSAARNGNTRLVQNLIDSGADVNYVDSTGVSVVCTAVMNNDTRAVQVLQMYGADASNCDKQIKNYKTRNDYSVESGVFSGLSSTHKLVLGAVAAGAVIGGLLWATDAFNGDNNNGSSGGTGNHSGSGGENSNSSSLSPAFTIPYGPSMVTASGSVVDGFDYDGALNLYSDSDELSASFSVMNNYGNYLLLMHGYSPFARGYMGQSTLRWAGNAPVPAKVYGGISLGTEQVSGGIPINVALVTKNGINAAANTSLADRFFVWSSMSGTGITDVNAASNTMISSKYFNNNVVLGTDGSAVSDDTVNEITSFDLSGAGTAIHNTGASDLDDLLAKIVGGYTTGDLDGDLTNDTDGDFTGFMPNGQLTIYRTGGGVDNSSNDINYYNYRALVDAASNAVTNSTTDALNKKADYGRAKVSVIANTDVISPLYSADAKTVGDFISLSSADYKTVFYNWVGTYYNNGVSAPTGYNTPAQDAESFFGGLGINYFPLTVFSVGRTTTDSEYSGAYQLATFENAAPLAFNNINKLFISVVAVNLPTSENKAATANATTVSGFTTSEKYALSQWGDGGGYYKSRICGIAGSGVGTIDPWCFAAVGTTDEQATAAAAGAAGVVKSAFTYLSNQQIFALLALTADGAYLGTNPSTGGAWASTDDLVSYLSSKFTLPMEYQTQVDNNLMAYLDAFKQVFGYGLINLERATTPDKSIYFYSGGKIVSASGNAYWRSATSGSSVFGLRGASIPVSFYDVISDNSGTINIPRIWNAELSLGNTSFYGLFVGDTLAELKTRDDDNTVKIGNFSFGFSRSERMYDDSMSGVDNLSVAYDSDRFGFYSDYQHYLTDGAGRFTGLSNPVLSLASNAVTSKFAMHNGRLSFLGRGFVGAITSEGLLDKDPAVSNNFEPAKLSDVIGAESGVRWADDKVSFISNIGTMHESNTVLGAVWGDMLNMHGADTNYFDSVVSYSLTDNLKFTLRGTCAWTHINDDINGIVNGVSELKSNAFAAGVKIGNFDLVASMPLALVDGKMNYSYADFSVNENNEVLVNNPGEYALDMTPDVREYRFNASYRHSFGEWTDGALGFIYRINPNNTNDFGNESIFMMKLSHRLGI